MDILQKIIQQKHIDILEDKKRLSILDLDIIHRQHKYNRVKFVESMSNVVANKQNAVIAEIKKASPSRGVIRENFNPVEHAVDYQNYGASAISVITDREFFMGSDSYLSEVKKAVNLPILRKDFIVDDYQVIQSAAIGADCILLIVSALNKQELNNLSQVAKHYNMDVLVEVHNKEELEIALTFTDTQMIGINNRNLKTFHVDLNTTIDLCAYIPKDKVIITESGIQQSQDIELMHRCNIYAFLVGETFMKQPNPGKAMQTLFAL